MNASVEERVKSIVAECCGCSEWQVTLASNFLDDFGADELTLMDIRIHIEVAFDISLPSAEEDPFLQYTVGNLIEYVQGQLDAA